MATVPTTPLGPGSASGSNSGGARKHRSSPFTSWLKKGNSSEAANSKKLASPAEEIKLVFLRQLEFSSFDLNGKHYHSVFTGAQIVDIILNHFGLPDRKLASNVASRLIDCSLYTHVSGPSQGAATAGTVIDSNSEIYTLTSEALTALKALHKGDTLQRAKTHTRRRYMDLRGHLHTRSVDSQGTSSSNISGGSGGNSDSSSNISSQHASIAGLNTSARRSSCDPPSPLSHTQALPPPLDVSAAHKSAIARAHRIDKSNSPSDTLVALGPATPSTSTPTTDPLDPTGSPLREVCIPTGDLGSLLNTWSFLGAGSVPGRHSLLPLTPASTSRSALRESSYLLPGDGAVLLSGAMESDNDDYEDGGGSDTGNSQCRQRHRHWLKHNRVSQRMSQDLESAEWVQQHQRQRRWALYTEPGRGTLRRCPSAPSLNEHQSDSDVSYLTAFRDSAQQRPSRDSWYGGSQLSDITVASSYVGTQFRGPFDRSILSFASAAGRPVSEYQPLDPGNSMSAAAAAAVAIQRLSVTSSLRPWHPARSSVGSHDTPPPQTQSLEPCAVDCLNMPTPRTIPASIIDSGARSRSSSVRTTPEAGPCRDSYDSSRRPSTEATDSRQAQQMQGRLSIEPAIGYGGRVSSATLGSGGPGDAAAPARQLQLWRDTVPLQLLQSLGQETIAQQEAIYELISTELCYLHDLELIDTVFSEPLLAQPEVMEGTRALEFLHTVFFNYRALIDNSRQLCAQLTERQQAIGAPVVAGVGDIFDSWADDLQAFVEYSVHVPDAQCELESVLLASPPMAQFLADAETAPEARRLPIQSFIGRPATRFARYPLLFDAIIKRSPSDAALLRNAATKVRAALCEIDRRTGDGATAHRIRQISQRLCLPVGARDSLALDNPARRLVKEGVLYVPETGARVLAFLFDNSLIVAAEERVAHAKGVSRYVADDRIIPISMLDACVPPIESGTLVGIREALRLQSAAARPALLRHSSSSSTFKAPRATAAQIAAGLPLSFLHIGCRALCRTLLVASEAERDQWMAAIARRICVPQTLVEAYTDVRMLSDRDFPQNRAPLCSALFAAASSGCQMVLFGSKDGLHLGIYGVPTSVIRVSQPGCVTKIHILHDFNLVIILSDTNLLVYSLSAIEKSTIAASSQLGAGLAGTKIASSVSFFDVGMFMAAPLIVLMKLRGSKSHFKCIQPRFNPIESAHGSSDSSETGSYGYGSSAGVGDTSGSEPPLPPPPRPSLTRSLPRSQASSTLVPTVSTNDDSEMASLRIVYQGTRTSLHLISEFGVPGKARRVHFLRRKLCIVSAKSFEIVDVQTSRLLRSLPDPMDDDFSFVIHSNDSGLAIATCKVGREFLLCYEAFAFYIDNFGRRSRPQVFIRWEMRPTHISFRHPYIVAVNPKFIEVRHIETGVLLSIIRIKNAVCLNPDSTSTVLHIAIGPATIGTALIAPNSATPPSAVSVTEETAVDESTSAMPQPTTLPAKPAADVDSVQGYIVPGLSGTSGKRLFPEGNSTHYRIIEVRLPPLKPSSSSRPSAPAASR
ncbi:RHO1 GDP-GTP exchange protein 2 [Coemansia aciculifera]|uniref:RHO1 GDP-GTP exchange protein 2 n=1 Tax=Coemansia aciculifera TaxID=417176 RepID=A0A9W8IMN0_9FUNG|nr:RHO1 GDP-GTP exchange protein 2 [Coemansia aciculifera]KAJ2877217.1 RHO1 GDP-GTP exchange protein 2 [Coemansia aciculifera]